MYALERRTSTAEMFLLAASARNHPSQLAIKEMRAYDRAADARQAAWDASPFAAAVAELLRYKGSSEVLT